MAWFVLVDLRDYGHIANSQPINKILHDVTWTHFFEGGPCLPTFLTLVISMRWPPTPFQFVVSCYKAHYISKALHTTLLIIALKESKQRAAWKQITTLPRLFFVNESTNGILHENEAKDAQIVNKPHSNHLYLWFFLHYFSSWAVFDSFSSKQTF